MSAVYVVRVCGRLGMTLGEPDRDHYVAGPFVGVADAEEAIARRWAAEETRENTWCAVVVIVAFLAIWLALPWIVGSDVTQDRLTHEQEQTLEKNFGR